MSALSLFACAATIGTAAAAEEKGSSDALYSVEVVAVTLLHGVGLPKNEIPANQQTATDEDLDRSEVLDLTDMLSLIAGGRYNYTNVRIRDILGNGPESIAPPKRSQSGSACYPATRWLVVRVGAVCR